MAVADTLIALNDAKNDMKSALVEKGVTPIGGLSTYADAIRAIGNAEWTPPNGIKFNQSTCKTIPLFDSSHMTDFYQMFRDCGQLVMLPDIDTSSAETMEQMCMYCFALQSFRSLNTDNVTTMGSMLFNCTTLTDVPLLNARNTTSVMSICTGCYELAEIGGFAELGFCQTKLNDKGKNIVLQTDSAFKGCKKITRQSVLNIFNSMYDVRGTGNNPELKFEKEVIARLEDEDIAIATNKGWIVGSYA